jgi:hypothetical protein
MKALLGRTVLWNHPSQFCWSPWRLSVWLQLLFFSQEHRSAGCCKLYELRGLIYARVRPGQCLQVDYSQLHSSCCERDYSSAAAELGIMLTREQGRKLVVQTQAQNLRMALTPLSKCESLASRGQLQVVQLSYPRVFAGANSVIDVRTTRIVLRAHFIWRHVVFGLSRRWWSWS